MNGKFSRQPFLSSVAKISCRLRTSIQSPTPKFSTPCRIELGVFMLTCLRGVDNSRADFKMLHEVWQTRWSHNVAFRASDRSLFRITRGVSLRQFGACEFGASRELTREFLRCPLPETSVRTTLIVFPSQRLAQLFCLLERREPVRVQAFGPQRPFERFRVCIVGRLPWTREIGPHTYLIRPQVHRLMCAVRICLLPRPL